MATVEMIRTKACRNLFGSCPVDNKRILTREANRLDEEMNQKWGFDFQKGGPMNNHDGGLEWVAIAMEEYIPESYKMPNIALDLSAKDYQTFLKNYNDCLHYTNENCQKTSTFVTRQHKGCQTSPTATITTGNRPPSLKRSAQKNITGKFRQALL